MKYDWEEWDRQIEADSADEKLDFLVDSGHRKPNDMARWKTCSA